MYDTHQLNVFLTAAEELNFTAAAQRLHMSQPSVSQHILSLEKQIGLPLFNRSGRHLSLSEAGLILLPLAREMVGRSIQIQESMESLKGDVYGHLTVGCSTTPGKYILPQLLAVYLGQYPRVRVTCQVAPQQEAIDMLSEGEVHFALASNHIVAGKDVEFTHFMSDRIVLICPLSHPWADRAEIGPDDLLDAEFIVREETSGTRAAVREALAGVGIVEDELNALLTLGNSEAIAIAVQEGLGVGFVSSLVHERIVPERTAVVPVRGLDIERAIYLGRNTRLPAAAAQKAFWEIVCDSAIQRFSDSPNLRLADSLTR